MAEVTFVAEWRRSFRHFRHFRHMSFLYFLRECIFFEKSFRVRSIHSLAVRINLLVPEALLIASNSMQLK
jgi:hypothetical protein